MSAFLDSARRLWQRFRRPERPSGGPTVRVILLTFNHEKWIAQAIESVLAQKADFGIEIVVIEDCSTDRTRDIVVEYAQKYPERIQLRLAAENRNSNVDWVQAMRDAQTSYVVTLDGDDYWTSPDKLRKQVRFMERHPDCALSYHNAECVYEESGETFNHNHPDQKQVTTFDDLLAANMVSTVGAMLRKERIDPLPDWLEDVKWGDWGLYLHAARNGTVRYMNEILAVYRLHSGGAWWGLTESRQIQGTIQFYEQMNANMGYEHDGAIATHIARLREMLEKVDDRAPPVAARRS
jgi:glycosyltransferase involved in cell wall biosynthesis